MSMFRFDCEKKEETADVSLAEGNASFKFIGIYETGRDGQPLVDRDGKPKLNVSVAVRDADDNTGIIYETLTVKTGWKISAMLEAIGLSGRADSGQMDTDDLLNGEGFCTLKIKPGTNGFADRIAIDKYLKASKQLAAKVEFIDDSEDLPF